MITMKQIAAITLIVLLGLIAYGMFRTGRSMTASQVTPGGVSPHGVQAAAIDQHSLYNARRLAQMPTSADEVPLAQEALRLSDREMDLAFAAGVREAQDHPAVLSAEAKQSETRLQNAEKALDSDKTRVAQLNSSLAKATGAKANSLADQLEEAKVQVELDQDELDNSKEELALAGGDTQGRIEQLLKEHDAASRVADTTTVNTTSSPELSGLVHRYRQWSELHYKKSQLSQAKRDAETSAVEFTTKRNVLASKIKTPAEAGPGTADGGQKAPSSPDSASSTHDGSADLVTATKRRSANMKTLTNFEERGAENYVAFGSGCA